MDEWAKVVIYPLGLVGFALLLLYRVHAAADKRRQSGQEPRPARILTSAAVISLLCGLTLAFLELRTSPASAQERRARHEAANTTEEPLTHSARVTSRPEPPTAHQSTSAGRYTPENNDSGSNESDGDETQTTRVRHASVREAMSDLQDNSEEREAQQQLRNLISSAMQRQEATTSRVCQTAVGRCTFAMPSYVGSVCTCIVPNAFGYPVHYPGAFIAQ
jgi:hypothetical protein